MKKITCLLIISLICNSCSILFHWNPVLNGVEFDKKINFNKDNIAISIMKFGFINNRFGPVCKIKIGNFSNNSIYLNARNFQILIDSDTLNFNDENSKSSVPKIIPPNKVVDLKLRYDFYRNSKFVYLENDSEISVNFPRSIKLILGSFILDKRTIDMPTIEFVDPKKIDSHEGYYEFRKTRFL